MARKTFSAPIKVVGSASTSTILETATSGDSQTAGTALLTADGDLTTSVGGQLQYLGPFLETNIATSIAAVAQTLGEVAGMTEICVGRAGSVIGATASLSANITAGTLTLQPTINGTTCFSAANATTTVRVVSGTQAKGTDTIAATDRIGLKLTTSANFAPTSLEGVFFVIVEV